MSPTQTSQVADIEPGQLLNELEQRQDDVLEQLDALDTQLQEVLRGLGVTLEDDLDELGGPHPAHQDDPDRRRRRHRAV